MSNKKKEIKYNTELQYYKGIPIRLIVRKDYSVAKAKRFTLNETNQNVWIPNKHLLEDGTLKPNENIDYVFKKAIYQRKFEYSGLPKNLI